MSAPAPPVLPRQQALRIAWITGAALLAMLFLGIPYQHWDRPQRSSVLAGWMHLVEHNEGGEWAFCLVMPLVVAWLVYHRRHEWQRLPLQGHWLGLGLMLLAAFCYWVGFKADVGYPGFIAMQLMLGGLVLLLAGKRWLGVLMFAWFFMFFMWPMSPLEDYVASPLRVFTARSATWFLNLVGVATEQQGSALQSAPVGDFKLGERFSLDVDKACAGLRSLYALLMISALVGYLFLKRWRSRGILFISAVPLAILGNFVRLVLLALGSLAVDEKFAVGRQVGDHLEMSWFHELAGYAVFAVALGGMYLVSRLLESNPLETMKARLKTSASSSTDEPAEEVLATVARGPFFARLGAAASVGVATLLLCFVFGGEPPISTLGVTMDMPTPVAGYQRVVLEGMTAAERDILQDDVEMIRGKYLGPHGTPLTAVIVTSGKLRRSLHPPEICSPAQGYTITARTPLKLRLADGRVVPARLLRMFKDYLHPETGERRRSTVLQLYAYIGANNVMANDYYQHVMLTYLHAVFMGVNHRWAMVSCVLPVSDAPIGQGDRFAEALGLQEAQDFALSFLPEVLAKPTPHD